MIDREQAVAVFQDAVDHADWSGRESVLQAGIDAILALETKPAPIGDPDTTEIINGWLVGTAGDEPEPLIDLKGLNGWPGRRIADIIRGTDWTDEQARDLGRRILRELES